MAVERVQLIVSLRDEISKGLGDIEDQADDLGDSFDDVDDSNRRMGRGFRRTDRDSKSLTQRLGALNMAMGGLGRIFTFIKIGAVIDGVRYLSRALTALTAATTALIGASGPLVGLGVLYPAIAAAFGQAAGALKIAFGGGISEGIAGVVEAANAADKAEALKALPEYVHDFALALHEGRHAMEDWRAVIGGKLFPQLADALETLVGIAPKFSKVMGATGGAIGAIAVGFSQMIADPTTMAALGRVMENNVGIIRNLGAALTFLAEGFIHMLDAARPFVDTMVSGMADAAENFRDFMKSGSESGELAEFFQTTYEVFQGWKNTIGDVLVGLYNIMSIGADWGSSIGRSWEESAATFRAWTESSEGIGAITEWFEKAKPVVEAFADVLHKLATDTLPAFTADGESTVEFLNALSDDGGFLDKLADFGEKFSEFGVLDSLVRLGEQAIRLFELVDPEPIKRTTDLILDFTEQVIDMLEAMEPGERRILFWSIAFWKLFGALKAIAGIGLFALIGSIAAAFGQFALGIASIVTGVGGVAATASIWAKIGAAIARVVAFVVTKLNIWVFLATLIVAGLIWMWNNVDWFREGVIAAWEWIVAATGKAVDTIVRWWNETLWPALQSIGTWIKDVFIAIWDGIVAAWQWLMEVGKSLWGWISETLWPILVSIGEFIAGVFIGAWNTLVTVFQTLWGIIEPIFTWWGEHVWPLLKAIGLFLFEVFLLAWDLVSLAIKAVSAAVAFVFMWLSENLWPMLQSVGSFLAEVFRAAWDAVAGAIQWVVDKVALLWGWIVDNVWPILQTVGGYVAGFFKEAWDGLVIVFEFVVEWLRKIWTWFSENVLPIMETVGSFLGDVFSPAWEFLKEGLDKVKDALSTLKGWWDNIYDVMVRVVSYIKDSVLGAFDDVKTGVENTLGRITGFFEGARERVAGARGWVQGLVPGGGDTATPRAASGGLGNTLALHGAASSAMAGSAPSISNVFHSKNSGSDHHAGRALDLVGSNLGAYASALRKMGGYAALHGAGRNRHLHAVYPGRSGDTPTSRIHQTTAMPGRGGGVTLKIEGPLVGEVHATSNVDVQTAVRDALNEFATEAMDRA